MENLPLAQSGRTALEVATYAAREAGNIILARFRSENEIQHKGKSNLVTKADILSDKLIVELLQNEYPECNILSEESHSSTPVVGYTWIVDPLDGTNNYVFGIPFFCTNIALAKDGDILLGLTYDPLREELFHAEKGRGAYLNNLAIHVTKKESLGASLIAFDLGYNDERGKELLDLSGRLRNQVHCLRTMGSTALGLAYVACGRISLYFHRWIYPWDIASGLLLVSEAGGKVTGWQGNQANLQSKEIIASNHRLHQEFMTYLG